MKVGGANMYTLCYNPNGFPMMVTTGDCKTRRKPLFPLQAGSTEKFIARQMIYLAIDGKPRRIFELLRSPRNARGVALM
jgi:hypothetical protein